MLQAKSNPPPFKLRSLAICIGMMLGYGHAIDARAEEIEEQNTQAPAQQQATMNGQTGETENQAVQQADVPMLEEVVVTGRNESRDERGYNEVFEKDVVNVYQGKEEIERYKGSAAADLFKGMNGVYSGDARNSGALDPNIRGIQGEGRVPLTVDGTEQATSIWLGPSGVSNRNYVDPNMIGGITVEKGPSPNSPVSGIGGSVQIRTLEPDDIVKPEKTFGIEIKGETATNSTSPDTRYFDVFGRDYREIPGLTRSWDGTASGIVAQKARYPKTGNGGKEFNFGDKSYRLAIATKQDKFSLLGAYSYRTRGNYFSGKSGANKYETNSWREEAERDAGGSASGFARPGLNYIAKFFLPGNEILNTSSQLESALLKGSLDLPNDQNISAGFMRSNHQYGENVPWNVQYAIWTLDKTDPLHRSKSNDKPFSEIKQNSWNLNYTWKPKDNPYIDLKAGLWMTQMDSIRHQNGDSPYGLMDSDAEWDRYTNCHSNGIGCFNAPKSPPEKLPNTDGRFNVVENAMQTTDHRRVGFNLSNRVELHRSLDITLTGDFSREKLREKNAADIYGMTDANWGSVAMGPRSGSRQQWNMGFNFDWRPTGWLQVNAGMRYSDYWSFDDGLSERRARKEPAYALQPAITGYEYRLKELMSDDEVAENRQMIINGYQNIIESHRESGWIDSLNEFLQKYPDAETYYNNSDNPNKVNGYWYREHYNDTIIEVPYDGTHRGFASTNPFLNGQFHNEQIPNAQGQQGSAPRYVARRYREVRGPELSDEKRFEQPKKQKDHAWVPNIGLTAFVSNNARVYARYSEFVRFPSVFEATQTNHGVAGKHLIRNTSKPEHAYNWEVGYVHNLTPYFRNLKQADFRINYFNNKIKDYIDRDWDMHIVQFEKKKFSGIELQARADSGEYFTNIGITYRLKQELCDKDYASLRDVAYGRISSCMDGGFPRTFARTSLQPKYSVNLEIGTRLLEKKLDLGARAVYHSEAKNDDEAQFGQIGWAYNQANYWNPIMVFDAYANYRMNENINMNFGVTNLTNKYYLDPMSRTTLPAPGRTIRVGMTVAF